MRQIPKLFLGENYRIQKANFWRKKKSQNPQDEVKNPPLLQSRTYHYSPFERMVTSPNVSHVRCHMSRVTCHMSRVTCHMSRVTCHMEFFLIFFLIFFLFFLFGQSGEVYRWRVCYQRGLPRLVFRCIELSGMPLKCLSICLELS